MSLKKNISKSAIIVLLFLEQSYDGYGNAEICITTDKYMFVINCPIVINALLYIYIYIYIYILHGTWAR